MDCVEVKQEAAVEIGVEDIYDSNNDSDDTNDPFDNCSEESVCNYDSDGDIDQFKEHNEYKPKNVDVQDKENKNRVHKRPKEILNLNDQVVKEASPTSEELVCKYESDSDNDDPFRVDKEYQPENVEGQVKENKRKVTKKSKQTLTLNGQVVKEASSTSSALTGRKAKRKILKDQVPSNGATKMVYRTLANEEYRCNDCEFVTTTKKYICRHIRTIHCNIFKQCPYCPHKTRDGASLKRHIHSRHKTMSEVDCYECHQCGHKSITKTSLRYHLLTHKKVEEKMDHMVKCNQCTKMFLKHNLGAHIKQVHKGHKKNYLSCHLCDYKLSQKPLLEEHIKRYHENNENLEMLSCEKCSFKTKFDFLLKRHIYKTHTHRYQCDKCPYQATDIGKIKVHMIGHQEVKNENDLKYRCDKCDYKTYRHYSLNVHKLNHLKPEEIQYFYCYHCDFKAKRKDNLKTHIKNLHFKKKTEFVCYICDFKANTKVSHIAHLGKHSREQNKKQKSEANHDDIKETQQGLSSSKNKEKPAPLKRRKVAKNDDDEPDKLDKNETEPLKSLCVNKKGDNTMTRRDRLKRKAVMPSLD